MTKIKLVILTAVLVSIVGCERHTAITPEHAIKPVAKYSDSIHSVLVFEYSGHKYVTSHEGGLLRIED